jgi:hypothetical protein
MRTIIYVHQPSTVTVQPMNAADKIQLFRYNQSEARSAAGTLKLEPGIYMIASKSGLQVSVGGIELHAMGGDKDDPPRPLAAALALEPGATQDSVAKFFAVALGL